jgi:hypothetical protein
LNSELHTGAAIALTFCKKMSNCSSQTNAQDESFNDVANSDDSRSPGIRKMPRWRSYLWYSLIPFGIIAIGSYVGIVSPEPGDVGLWRVPSAILAMVCLFLATGISSMIAAALSALVASLVLKKNSEPLMFRVYITLMLVMAVLICTALLMADKSGGHKKGRHKKQTYFFHGGPQF